MFQSFKRIPAWAYWIGLLLLLVLPIPILSRCSAAQVERLNAHLRAQGIPVTDEEYAASPKPPEEKNAAALYLKSVQAMQDIPNDSCTALLNTLRTAPQNPLSNDQLQQMTHVCLAPYALTLRYLRQAALYPECDSVLPADVNPFHYYSSLRFGAQLLCIESLCATQAGNAQQALESLHAALAAGNSSQSAPHWMELALRNSIHQSILEFLPRILANASFTEPQWRQLQNALRSVNAPGALQRGLIRSRIALWADYPNAYRDSLKTGRTTVPRWARHFLWTQDLYIQFNDMPAWKKFDQARFMRAMNQIIESSALPYPDALDSIERMGRKFVRDPELLPRSSNGLIQCMVEDARRFARNLALFRLAETAATLERFRCANGGLPERLTELVPAWIDAVPLDPFDGAPIRYRTTENGYTLYSVYENRTDDGGQPRSDTHKDLGFTVEIIRPDAS